MINQRISQSAVRRANGLDDRLRAGLTGGDLRPGAIDATRLAAGVSITSAGPAGPQPPPTVTIVASPRRRSTRGVHLTGAQLLVNQRIAQAGVRRANALAATLAEGLVFDDFRPATVTSTNLDPVLRG